MAKKIAVNTGIEILYNNIKQVLDGARNVVYKTANKELVCAYWQIGKLIIEEEQQGKQRAGYGDEIIKQLSARLQQTHGSGFNRSNLWYMRQFYTTFKKLHAVRGELTWTHYRILLKVDNKEARSFYIQEAIACNWSTRTLERQINNLYFERLLRTQADKRSLIKKEADKNKQLMDARDFIKDPYVLTFLELKPNTQFYEQELEQAIIDKLQEFLLELGKGFSFVGRQQRISLDGEHFYIDLVFYNYILKCFLLIDLKTGKLTHQDVGQMDMYVRIYEEQIRQDNDNPTIGLILCADKNNAVAKYSLLNDSKQIFASKYKTYLPTEKQLKQELEREQQAIELERRLRK